MNTTTFFGKRLLAGSLTALGFCAFSSGLLAQPTVDYTITGTSGDYTLDFTVNNASPGTGNQDIYLFGIYDPNATISGSPAPYTVLDNVTPYDTFFVGTTLTYNDGWQDPGDMLVPPEVGSLPPGTSLSGFTVLDTSASAPTTIPYYAFGYGGGSPYLGPGNLIPDSFTDYASDSLFEGDALQAGGNNLSGVADDGATMPLLALALGALGGVFHKLRTA